MEAFLEGIFRAVYSDALLGELAGVLQRPRIRNKYGLGTGNPEALLVYLRGKGEQVEPSIPVLACRDAKDDMVLEAAVAGQADVIVSADKDLLALHPFQGIPIVEPGGFLEMLEREKRA